jgi:hypothetical protein
MSWTRKAARAPVVTGTLTFSFDLSSLDLTSAPGVKEMYDAFRKEIEDAFMRTTDEGMRDVMHDRIRDKYVGLMHQKMPELKAGLNAYIQERVEAEIDPSANPDLSLNINVETVNEVDPDSVLSPEQIFNY